MSAREEEEHDHEVIIKTFMKALMDMKDFLKPSNFDWNSSDQNEDFWLLIKGMESWYMLQGILEKDVDTTWLGYLLNFLGPILKKEEKLFLTCLSALSQHWWYAEEFLKSCWTLICTVLNFRNSFVTTD